MLGLALNLRNAAFAAAIAFASGALASNAVTRWYYRAEIAGGEARAARTDTKAADQLNESAGSTAAELSADDAHNADVTRDILKDMAGKSAADRCRIDAAAAARLRQLR